MKIFLLVTLAFMAGYAFSFVSAEWYAFVNSNFIDFCRWINLSQDLWVLMDKYIFFGAL